MGMHGWGSKMALDFLIDIKSPNRTLQLACEYVAVCTQQYSWFDFRAFKDLAQQMFLDMYINTLYTLGECMRSISLENA